ncbi:MAG: hypothetical protein PHP57_13935 [Sideroxydans sp.]|nr:hypothetical protein [Sideroxydans sp.]
MAIAHFTRLCAFFRLSVNKALLFWLYHSSSVRFSQFLSLGLCGRWVFVSRFPALVPGFSRPSGWYFVASISIDHGGFFEIGLGLDDDIDYYYFSDLEVTNVR